MTDTVTKTLMGYESMEHFSFVQTGERYQIEAEMLVLGRDGCILIYGGDEPHIGAVAVGGDGVTPQDNVFPGHKEDGIVRRFRETILSKGLLRHCVVICGIHYDDLDAAGIQTILSMSEKLLAQLCRTLKDRRQ